MFKLHPTVLAFCVPSVVYFHPQSSSLAIRRAPICNYLLFVMYSSCCIKLVFLTPDAMPFQGLVHTAQELYCGIIFWTAPFSKCFLSTGKWEASGFKFLRFKERVQKHPFSWRTSVDGRPNRRIKAVFSKCFLSTGKWDASIFKFLWCKERVGKHPFSWQICVDG